LNCDVKILAKVLEVRVGHLLDGTYTVTVTVTVTWFRNCLNIP
jgi:hypothetical protein